MNLGVDHVAPRVAEHRPRRGSRPPLRRLGVNPVSLTAFAGQLLVLVVTLTVLHRAHVTVEPFSATRVLLWPVAFLPWIYFVLWPGGEHEWAIPDSIAALLLISRWGVGERSSCLLRLSALPVARN